MRDNTVEGGGKDSITKTDQKDIKQSETEKLVTKESGTEEEDEDIEEETELDTSVPMIWAGGIAAAAVVLSVMATLLIQKFRYRAKARKMERMKQEEPDQEKQARPGAWGAHFGVVGKVHNIGSRPSQQDSLGVVNLQDGIFAVVADGMGGLSDGDKVSQKIVLTMMQDADQSKEEPKEEDFLYQMVSHANREVNRMLGVSSQYKSGSTVVAVLAERDRFQWISVGDSRIYLYRGGSLLQINREHIYEADLLQNAVNQRISFTEAASDRQRKKLTSFIGMGELRYLDGGLCPVSVQPGDKVALMSDGVFHTISDQEIAAILSEAKDAQEAASIMEHRVLARRNPRQDNFTAVILDF